MNYKGLISWAEVMKCAGNKKELDKLYISKENKVYCTDCEYNRFDTDCYATASEPKTEIDYVTGSIVETGIDGIVSCYSRNKNGNCKHYKQKMSNKENKELYGLSIMSEEYDINK